MPLPGRTTVVEAPWRTGPLAAFNAGVAQMRNTAYLCSVLSEREIGRRLRELLQEYLGLSIHAAEEATIPNGPARHGPDYVMSAGPHRFVIEAKSAGSTDQVASAIRQLEEFQQAYPDAIPLVVVPFMSTGGRAYAAERGMSWLDLSGNASISGPAVRILVDGKPNQFVRPGRPRDLFAPRSARVTRALLLEPFAPRSQIQLARATGLNSGTVSRVVAALLEGGFVERISWTAGETPGAVRVVDPNLLLDAWREAADFSVQRIHRYAVAARTGEDLAKRAAAILADAHVDPAATGLVAAWCYAPYADFRTVSFYVRELPPTERLLKELGAREEPRGGNLWLVLPKDEGVRMGLQVLKGIPCVSAVQTYVDLRGHPERASDAATAIKDEYLRWPVTSPRETGIPRDVNPSNEARHV
jgi:hypothetical protein